VDSLKRESPEAEAKMMRGWDRISGRRRHQPERCDERYLASILGLTFETLKALI
jgi:hypothetical protein